MVNVNNVNKVKMFSLSIFLITLGPEEKKIETQCFDCYNDLPEIVITAKHKKHLYLAKVLTPRGVTTSMDLKADMEFIPITHEDSLIIKYSREYNVPSLMIKAQAIEETSEGKTGVGKRLKNWFGHKGRKGFRKFNSAEESIVAHCKLIKKRYRPLSGEDELFYWLTALDSYNASGAVYCQGTEYRERLTKHIYSLNLNN